MTTHSRIAAFLSTSALCLGLAAAPSAFAAGADATTKAGDTKTHAQHKHHKSDYQGYNSPRHNTDIINKCSSAPWFLLYYLNNMTDSHYRNSSQQYLFFVLHYI